MRRQISTSHMEDDTMTDNTTDTNTDDTQSLDKQFTGDETLVECYAGGRPGTGKTTRLIEWFRAQHGDETVLTVIDPTGDSPSDPSPQDGAVSRINPLDIESHYDESQYRLPGGSSIEHDEEGKRP